MGGLRDMLVACALLVAPGASAATVFDSSLRLAAEERYDDDFRLRSDGGTGGQLMTKLTPRLGVTARSPRLTSEAFYATDLLARHGSGRVTLDHRAGLEARYLLTRRLTVDVSGRFFRVTDPTSLPREGVARSSAPTLYGQGRLMLTGRVTSRLDARVSYGFEGAHVDMAGLEPSYVHTPSAELLFRSTRRLTLGLEYRYQGFILGEQYSDAHGAFGSLRYRLSRVTTLSVRGGPVFFRQEPAVGGSGALPRVALELMRDGEHTDWGFAIGHDLVGASGFTNAVWADYASLMGTRQLSRRLSVFGAASYFRNGRPPGRDFFLVTGARLAQGYAVGAGVEYRWNRRLSMQGALDRVAQVGAEESGTDLTRNILAVRLIYSAW